MVWGREVNTASEVEWHSPTGSFAERGFLRFSCPIHRDGSESQPLWNWTRLMVSGRDWSIPRPDPGPNEKFLFKKDLSLLDEVSSVLCKELDKRFVSSQKVNILSLLLDHSGNQKLRDSATGYAKLSCPSRSQIQLGGNVCTWISAFVCQVMENILPPV